MSRHVRDAQVFVRVSKTLQAELQRAAEADEAGSVPGLIRKILID
jgi:hypothetical protein